MATAFVLLNAELGAEIEVLNGLKMIDEVKETHLIYGVYDIIARIEADTMDDLRKVIGWNIRRLTRVRSTITMICLRDPQNIEEINREICYEVCLNRTSTSSSRAATGISRSQFPRTSGFISPAQQRTSSPSLAT